MPRSEPFGLTTQLRHAAVSIPSHIAERYNRKTTPEYMRSLRIASGSQADLSTQYEIAIALDLIKPSQQTTALLTEVDRLLFALIRKLNP
jgi:four helix bundle protein